MQVYSIIRSHESHNCDFLCVRRLHWPDVTMTDNHAFPQLTHCTDGCTKDKTKMLNVTQQVPVAWALNLWARADLWEAASDPR